MKHAKHLLILVFLFAVWPVQGQTPTTAADYFNRGIHRQDLGDLDGAIADYTKAIEIDPRDAQAYENLGLALLTKGKDQEAEQDFKKAIELDATLKPEIEKLSNEIKQARKVSPKP